MKLSPEHIAKLEAILTDYEDGITVSGIVIEHNLETLQQGTHMLSFFRRIGVPLQKRKGGRSSIPLREQKEFVSWLRDKRARENAERGLQ